MPLGVTLLDLRRELRAETGTSLNPAQGVAAQGTIDLVLARQQMELWDAYNWQHLKIWADVPLAHSQALYSYPKQMGFDQITRIYVSTGASSNWQPLAYGVSAYMMPRTPRSGGHAVALAQRRHRRYHRPRRRSPIRSASSSCCRRPIPTT